MQMSRKHITNLMANIYLCIIADITNYDDDDDDQHDKDISKVDGGGEHSTQTDQAKCQNEASTENQ